MIPVSIFVKKSHFEALIFNLLFLKASVRYDGIPFELRRIETLEMKQVLSEFDEINKSPESYKQYDSINAIIMEAMSYD